MFGMQSGDWTVDDQGRMSSRFENMADAQKVYDEASTAGYSWGEPRDKFLSAAMRMFNQAGTPRNQNMPQPQQAAGPSTQPQNLSMTPYRPTPTILDELLALWREQQMGRYA
jgi:hypothetical protein